MLQITCFICCELFLESPACSTERIDGCLLKSLIDVLGINYSTFTRDLLEEGNFEEVNEECSFCTRCRDLIFVGADLRKSLTSAKQNLIDVTTSGYQKRQWRRKIQQEVQSSKAAVLATKLALRLGECFTKTWVIIRPGDDVPTEKLKPSEPLPGFRQQAQDESDACLEAEFDRGFERHEPEEEPPKTLVKRKRGREDKEKNCSYSSALPKCQNPKESDDEIVVSLDGNSVTETNGVELEESPSLPVKRKRGRPRKPEEAKFLEKKKRGRQPKEKSVAEIEVLKEEGPSRSENSQHAFKTGKKQGRPPKNRPDAHQWTSQVLDIDFQDDSFNGARLRPRTCQKRLDVDLSSDCEILEDSDSEFQAPQSDKSSEAEFEGDTKTKEPHDNKLDRKHFECETCGKNFRRRKNLQKHAAKHTRKGSKMDPNFDETVERVCPICEYTCFSSFSMYIHEKQVHNLKSFARFDDHFYNCFTCLALFEPTDSSELPGRLRFKDLDKLKEFANEHAHCTLEPRSEFRCSQCSNTFSQPKQYVQHAIVCQRKQEPMKYPCTRCPLAFDNNLEYLHHSRQQHADRMRLKCQCYRCGQQFLDIDSLRNHVLESFKLLRCPGCGQNFQGTESFQNHVCKLDPVPEPEEIRALEVPSHCAQLNGGFPCLSCEKVYNTVGLLSLHFQEHHDKAKDNSFNCNICNQVLTHSETLEKSSEHPDFTSLCAHHWKTCSSRPHSTPCSELAEPQFECYVCQQKQDSSQSLAAHLNEHHGASEVHQCPGCTLLFRNTKYFRAHLKTSHNVKLWLPARCYYCRECQIPFQSDNPNTEQGALAEKDWPQFHNFLEQHFQCKADKVSPKCKYCSTSFVLMINLFAHEIRMHTKNFTQYCEVCGKGCANEGELHLHMKTHDIEKGDRQKPTCHICGKTFSTEDYLQQHLKTHDDQGPPLMCQHCGKGFYIKTNLRRHERNHLTVKPTEPTVPCTICGKLFTTVKYMKYHIIYNHEKRPRAKHKPSLAKEQEGFTSGMDSAVYPR